MSVKIPKELREVLLSIPGTTAIAMNINHGPAIVIKATLADAVSMVKKGVVIVLSPQLGMFDHGAVFRLYVEFRDQARRPVKLDTFLNPSNKHDLALLRLFTQSHFVEFYIFDTQLRPQGVKRINFNERTRGDMVRMIDQAIAHNASLENFDYTTALEQAKTEFSL